MKKGGSEEKIDRYAIISTLSRHSRSTVWLAEHKSIGVKRIIKGIPRDPDGSRAGTREAEILKSLNHQCIPELYDVFEYENYICLVEEYFKGESLASVCTHRLLSSKEVSEFIIQICSIIQYLHELPEAVLHLDIKPENVIISNGRACLIDFGSAVMLKDNSGGKTMSRGFSAPEQEACLKVDRAADVYSLGKLLEFMLSHSSIGEAAAGRLMKISASCSSSKPWKRVSSAGTMLKMLKKQRRSETEEKSPEQTAGSLPGSCRSIGVIGLGPRNGTTHVAIALANYLADVKGFEVCLAEKSDHSDIGRIPELIEAGRDSDAHPVRRNGVTYLTAGYAYETGFFKNKRFDYVIYDLGSNAHRAESVLMKCDTEIAVGSAAPGCTGEYLQKGKEFGQGDGNRKRLILINPADRSIMKRLSTGDLRVLPFPYEPDPLRPGKETIKVLERAVK